MSVDVKLHEIKVVSFGEKKPTQGLGLSLLFVPRESSEMEFGSYEELDTDHMNTCKPENDEAPQFKKIVALIRKALSVRK